MTLVLLHTSFCHLCDQAQALLDDFAKVKPITYTKIDISESEALMSLYGQHIPVLLQLGDSVDPCRFTEMSFDELTTLESTAARMNWPFGLMDLTALT